MCRLLHFGQGIGTDITVAPYSISNARKVLLHLSHVKVIWPLIISDGIFFISHHTWCCWLARVVLLVSTSSAVG